MVMLRAFKQDRIWSPQEREKPLMTEPPALLQEGHLCDAQGRARVLPTCCASRFPACQPTRPGSASSSLSLKLVSPEEYIKVDYSKYSPLNNLLMSQVIFKKQCRK